MRTIKQQRYLFAGVMLIATFFRLYDLGRSPVRADSLDFWNICASPISAWWLLTHWPDIMLGTGHFPLALVVTKAFINVIGKPLTEFALTIPSALWGVLAVAVMYHAGKALCGASFGLVTALLLAVNPFHVQLSREPYYYAPLVAGAAVLAWSLADERWWILAVGLFLTCYSQVTGWWLAGSTILVLVLRGPWRQWQDGARTLLISAFVMLPLCFAPWGVPYFLDAQTSPEVSEMVRRTQGFVPAMSPHAVAWKLATLYGWGATLPRGIFTAAVLILAALALRRDTIQHASVLVIAVALCYAAARMSGTWFAYHHYAFALPLFLLLGAGGLWLFPKVRVAVVCVAVALSLWPSYLATQYDGKATPYKLIQSWFDNHMPSGTPVLVDRWLEVGNELRVYNSTNACFGYLYPNEPLDVFTNTQWRTHAEHWFEANPNAVYLEIAKSYWAQVGPWRFPRDHFSNHTAITNEAWLKVAALGLAYRGDADDPWQSRAVVEIFWNQCARSP